MGNYDSLLTGSRSLSGLKLCYGVETTCLLSRNKCLWRIASLMKKLLMPWRKRGKKAVLKQKKPVVGERWTFKRSKRSVVQDLGSGRPGSVRKRDGALRVDDPPKTPGKNAKRGILQVVGDEAPQRPKRITKRSKKGND